MNSNTKSHCFGCVLWRAIWWKFANLQVLWQNSQNGSQHFGGGGFPSLSGKKCGDSTIAKQRIHQIWPTLFHDSEAQSILGESNAEDGSGGTDGAGFFGGDKALPLVWVFFFRNPSFATGWFWALFVYGSFTQEPGDLGSGWKHRWKPPQSLYNKKW